MLGLFLGTVLAVAPAEAPHQPPAAAPGLWRQENGRAIFTIAQISLPTSVGVTRFTGTFEFSHAGEGLDTGIQLESPDHQVFATVYVYYPALADPALAAFATDEAIHTQSPQLQSAGMQVAAAGGQRAVALRADYHNFRGGLASSAAFIEVGPWVVKLRVSGPEARATEVNATMDALMAGLRFEGDARPRSVTPIEAAGCPAAAVNSARLLAADGGQDGTVVFAILDATGVSVPHPTPGEAAVLLARFPHHWCASARAGVANARHSILRADPRHQGAGDSVIAVPINDAGTVLEGVETEGGHVALIYHEIGQSSLLGIYDRAPSDAQINDILSGADEPGGRIHAVVRHRPGHATDVEIIQQAAPANAARPPR